MESTRRRDLPGTRSRPRRSPHHYRTLFREAFERINQVRRDRGQEPLGEEFFPRDEERLLRLARNNKVKLALQA